MHICVCNVFLFSPGSIGSHTPALADTQQVDKEVVLPATRQLILNFLILSSDKKNVVKIVLEFANSSKQKATETRIARMGIFNFKTLDDTGWAVVVQIQI